ncbi:hypothetical protein [Burkholderia cepacia]|uniref:hypothetical protein n=1 Tax=Burkholderia cepacia TaxID=292 RepID=UPI003EE35ACA
MEDRESDLTLQLHLLFSEIKYFVDHLSHNRGINGYDSFVHHAEKVMEMIPDWIDRHKKITQSESKP